MALAASSELAESWSAVLWSGVLGSVVGTVIGGLITVLVAWRLYVHERDERRQNAAREIELRRSEGLNVSVANLAGLVAEHGTYRINGVPSDAALRALFEAISEVGYQAAGREPKLLALLLGLTSRGRVDREFACWYAAIAHVARTWLSMPEHIRSGFMTPDSAWEFAERQIRRERAADIREPESGG